MFPYGSREVFRGFREGDTARLTVGALLLLGWAYRWYRDRTSLIASYELVEGEELRLSVPKDRWVRASDVEAAALAELGLLSPADLDDDLLGAAPTEDEGEQRQDDDADDQ